jgi:hypothetical protein
MFTSVKHQVFKQVSEACFSRFLIFGSHMVPDINGDDRCFMVLVYDQSQPVVEGKFLERDIDLIRVEE